MVVITELPDGNWHMKFDWAIPEDVDIENGEILMLRDELVRMFGIGDIDGR